MNVQRRPVQRGMALVVGLILLALMTVMAVTSFSIGRTSMDIVGNMQRRNEVVAAANNTIQEALSTIRLFQSPDTIFLNPCTNQNTRCFDTDGDGDADDIAVELTPTPTCLRSQIMPNGVLNLTDPDEAACATGAAQVFGIAGAATGSSLCAETMWEIVAVATDAITEAAVTVTMGTGVRVSTDDIGTACP